MLFRLDLVQFLLLFQLLLLYLHMVDKHLILPFKHHLLIQKQKRGLITTIGLVKIMQ